MGRKGTEIEGGRQRMTEGRRDIRKQEFRPGGGRERKRQATRGTQRNRYV